MDSKTASSNLEIRKMLVLSTAHVSRMTALMLNTTKRMRWPVTGGHYADYGWMMYASEDQADDVPDDLFAVFVFARANGCDNVLFDRDAEEIEGLPTFDGNGEEIFPGWSVSNAELAAAEGWNLFDANGYWEIQADDEAGIIADDDKAENFVRELAAYGSALHHRAITIHDENANERVLDLAKGE